MESEEQGIIGGPSLPDSLKIHLLFNMTSEDVAVQKERRGNGMPKRFL